MEKVGVLEDQVGELWAATREQEASDMEALVGVSLCPCDLS